jgi:hypothetical protein
VKRIIRNPDDGRSGYWSLVLFTLAYFAAFALVLAPDASRMALDALASVPVDWLR